MRHPEFDQFRSSLLRQGKPLAQKDRESYLDQIVRGLEESGLFLVQKARKDGHEDALIEIHVTWIGTAFSTEAVADALQEARPADADEMRRIEFEDEVVTLEFARKIEAGTYLTGRTKVTL